MDGENTLHWAGRKKGVSTLSRDFQDSQRPQIGWGEHPSLGCLMMQQDARIKVTTIPGNKERKKEIQQEKRKKEMWSGGKGEKKIGR